MNSNTLDENLRWRHKWWVQLLQWSPLMCQSSTSLLQHGACRSHGHPPHAPIEPPLHPTYDLAEVRLSSGTTWHCCTEGVQHYQRRFWHGWAVHLLRKQLLHKTQALHLVLLQVVQSALAEDAGELGDVTTLST